jgi:hypothetical protein
LVGHPLTHGLDIDDPHTTSLRCKIIQEKKLLQQIYQEWYQAIAMTLPSDNVPVVKLGGGPGL